MAEVVKLLEDLSEKFDALCEDVDSLKERAGKQKRKEQAFTPTSHQSPQGNSHQARENNVLSNTLLSMDS